MKAAPRATSLPAAASQSSAENLRRLERAIDMVSQLDYGSAAVELTDLELAFESDGDVAHAAMAAFWLGYCREKQGQPLEAAAQYRKTILLCPASLSARAAQQRLADLPG